MKKPTIIIGFTRYSNGQLAIKARTIISRMTGNAHFPDPSPTLAEVAAQADAFDAALQALDGSEAHRLIFDQQRKALESKLRFLGIYVVHHGNDDPVILESSGFDLTKEPEKQTAPLPVPQNFEAVPQRLTGAMALSCDPLPGARTYNFGYRLPGTDWTTIGNTRPQLLLEGLTPGLEYEFRVHIVGTNGRQVVSPAIRRHAS